MNPQTFSRFRQLPQLEVGEWTAPAPSRPVDRRGDDDLERAVQWSNERRGLHFEKPDPPQDEQWDWLVDRGLEDPRDYYWIYENIVRSGLDCVIEIDELPEGINWFWDARSAFWTEHRYNLIKIKTMPGPLWLNFIASDKPRENPDYPFHISLCYRDELYEWYKEDRDHRKIIEWIERYRKIQRRYNGRRARLMTDQRLTRGHTFVIGPRTRVEGLTTPHIIYDGPGGDTDVRYVHTLPGHTHRGGKADQDLHVSLIM
jgi:hypothetical protein